MSIKSRLSSAAALVVLAALPAQAQTYPEPTVLQVPPGGGANATMVFNSGQIIGNLFDSSQETISVGIWTSATSAPSILQANAWLLGAAPGGGMVYLDQSNNTPVYRASATSSPTTIAFPSGWIQSQVGVNDLGQLVTAVYDGFAVKGIFMASATSPAVELPVGSFAGDFFANGINNSGQIVGTLITADGNVPVYWSSPAANPVALSSGSFSGPFTTGINDSGVIVGGDIIPTSGEGRPLVWSSPAAAPQELPHAGLSDLYARGINSDGDIAGASSGGQVPLIWAGSEEKTPAELVAEACPPTNTWKNHGQYVSCVAKASDALVSLGKATKEERKAIVTAAAQSSIGK
jgi:hypothetical protein